MADPLIPRDDPSIPVLTEILDVPFDAPSAPVAAAPVSAPAASAPLIQQAIVTPAPDVTDETVFADMRAALLRDLEQRLDPILRERVQVHVAAAVDRVMQDLLEKVHDEIGQMLDEGLNKELIRQAALVEPQRARPRPD